MKALIIGLLACGLAFGHLTEKQNSGDGTVGSTALESIPYYPDTGISSDSRGQMQYTASGSFGGDARFTLKRSRWHKAWKVSAVVLGAVSIADGVSSNGLSERNPLLGRGEFGSRQVSIKAAIVAGALVGQWWAVKKKPELERVFVFTNVGVAGLTSWAVVHNVKASQ